MTWPHFDPRCQYGLIPWDRIGESCRCIVVRWVVGALSGWIGHLWASGKHSRDLVNNRMRRLRALSMAHSRVPYSLIRKTDEWCSWEEEEYEKKAEPLHHHLIACLPSIAPLNEPRLWVNMQLGCQSIPVTCNTNTQNLLLYKINVLLVPLCIVLAGSHCPALKSAAAHVWQIMDKYQNKYQDKGKQWMYDIRSKLYSIHFKQWMFIFIFFCTPKTLLVLYTRV